MAALGPDLKKLIDSHPQWMRATLASEFESESGRFEIPAFTIAAYAHGYGRLQQYGLPTDGRALKTLQNPNDPFWASTEGRKKDLQSILSATHAWLAKAGVHTTTQWTLGPLSFIAKIPILGPVITAAASPITAVAHLAEGQRIDQALLDAAKSQLGAVRAVAPYAATVVSLVPGLGTGIAAVIGAGAALAEGKPIDAALENAIASAIPGGAIATTGFELAKKVASGQNITKAAFDTARAALSSPDAQKAFDIGIAVSTGKQLQGALNAAVANLTPQETKQILDTGTKAIQSTPGLASLAQILPSDSARQGLQLASGLLASQGVNEAQVRAMRAKLSGDVLQGFDAALQSQAAHYPWLNDVITQSALQSLAQLTPDQQQQLANYVSMQQLAQLTPDQQAQLQKAQASSPPPAAPKAAPAPPKAAPKPSEPTRSPTAAAKPPPPSAPSPYVYGPYPKMKSGVGALGAGTSPAASYGPYPKMQSGVGAPPHAHHSGGGAPHARPSQFVPRGAPGWWWGVPWSPKAPSSAPSCNVWGAPVEVPPAMQTAARIALNISKGQPTTVMGPDGVFYLFEIENGVISARPCAATS